VKASDFIFPETWTDLEDLFVGGGKHAFHFKFRRSPEKEVSGLYGIDMKLGRRRGNPHRRRNFSESGSPEKIPDRKNNLRALFDARP
jgi:hypothetical protein